MPQKTALVIGASRGLGLGLAQELAARGWAVIATVRGEATPGALSGMEVERVDINHTGEVLGLRDRLAGRRLDLLFVNAGIANGPGETVAEVTTEGFHQILTTNALSPLRVIEALAGGVAADGTIAVMSSGLGSVANNTTGGWEAYRASKAALNTMLRSYAARAGAGRTLLAVGPGWVRTDMGGPDATLDVATSVRGMVTMLEARAGSGGCAFVNYLDQVLPW